MMSRETSLCMAMTSFIRLRRALTRWKTPEYNSLESFARVASQGEQHEETHPYSCGRRPFPPPVCQALLRRRGAEMGSLRRPRRLGQYQGMSIARNCMVEQSPQRPLSKTEEAVPHVGKTAGSLEGMATVQKSYGRCRGRSSWRSPGQADSHLSRGEDPFPSDEAAGPPLGASCHRTAVINDHLECC